MAREIKILGSGCARCEALYNNAKKAVEELGIEAEVKEVKDLTQIAAHGVMQTPALVVDGKVVSQGKVLTAEEIKKVLSN